MSAASSENPTAPPSDPEIQAALAIITRAEEAGNTGLSKVLVINKTLPKGWNPATNSPYYKEKYAKQFKLHVDKILEDREKVIKLKPIHCKLITMYQKLVQGQLYLCDHMDTPDDLYKMAKKNLEIRRLKNENVILILWKDNPLCDVEETSVQDVKASIAAEKKWMKELEEFVETAEDGATFSRRNIFITEEDKAWVRTLLMPLGNFHLRHMATTRIEVLHKDFSKFE